MNKYCFVLCWCNPIDFGEIRRLKIRKEFSLWSQLIHKHGTFKPWQRLFREEKLSECRNPWTLRYEVARYFFLEVSFCYDYYSIETILLVFSSGNLQNSHYVWHPFSNHRTVAGRSLCKNSTLKTSTENVGKNYKKKRTEHTSWSRIAPETTGLFKSSWTLKDLFAQ